MVLNNNGVRPVFLLQASTNEWTPSLLTTHAAIEPIGRDTEGECRATWHAVLCFNRNRQLFLRSKQACYSLGDFLIIYNMILAADSRSVHQSEGLTRQNQAGSCQWMTFFWQSLVSERQDSISSRWLRYEIWAYAAAWVNVMLTGSSECNRRCTYFL